MNIQNTQTDQKFIELKSTIEIGLISERSLRNNEMENLMNIMKDWSEETGKGLMGLRMKVEEEVRRREGESREVQVGFQRMEEEVVKVKGKVDEFFEDFKVKRKKKKKTITVSYIILIIEIFVLKKKYFFS